MEDKVSESAKSRNLKILKSLKKDGIDDYLKSLERKEPLDILMVRFLIYEFRFPRKGTNVVYQIKIWGNFSNTYSATIINENREEHVIGYDRNTIKEALLSAFEFIKNQEKKKN
jgi:hypothetical protein